MITFYTGGMFAGKTTSLILHANRRTSEGKRVAIIKPSFDIRDGKDVVKTHDNVFKECFRVKNLKNILGLIDQVDVFCIDEIQFFDTVDVETIKELKSLGKEVVISGLDLDYKREWFKTSLAIYDIADVRETLIANCNFCSSSAGFSLRISESKELFELGSEEKYLPVCIDCHRKHFK